MFEKILIANRGEIACRIIDTAHRMGVASVAVYSDADKHARHVKLADEAVYIGGNAPADSYLKGDLLIRTALDIGAQAIHPGYGFLSENPDFVQAVENAGLVFIGPSADAIRKMGLKDAAKALMEKADVPVVPGYHGADQDAEVLRQAADNIGYPVLIKAVAGGGGKGMRLVERPEDFEPGLQSARSEAQAAFGNPAVLIEKFVASPRHIEVQVFGDGERAIHLFERDCSLQRRHQKVIEEAPAPGMTDEMRRAMGAAAVKAAQAIGYKGAGTVEFIVDGSGGLRADRFYFMEMNTRLQVEHPVTEEITGIDLVAWQLRVAAGERLQIQQEDLQISGHAFEARLYAEDVRKGFLPATGTLSHLEFPDIARIDTGVLAGDTISPWYDPMIAKITVKGATRAEALRRLQRALEETEVAGAVTNLEFLSALASHEGFGQGQVDTGLIERDFDLLMGEDVIPEGAIIAAAQTAIGLQNAPDACGFTLWAPLRHSVDLLSPDGTSLECHVVIEDSNTQVWSWADCSATVCKTDTGWHLDGAKLPKASCTESEITVFAKGGIVFTYVDPLARDTGQEMATNAILAPMPGLVRDIFAKPGQDVCKGDRLLVLEAMKMEHVLTAGRDGTIAEVTTAAGAQVAAGDVLIQLAEEAQSDAD